MNGDFTFIIEVLDREMSHILGDGRKVKFHGRYEDITTQWKSKEKKPEKVLKKNISYINHYLQFKDPKICELLAKAGLVMILLSVIIIGQNSGTECSNLSDYITLTQEKKLISLNPPKHAGYKSFQPDVSRLKQALELTEKLIFTVESHRRALTIILHKTSMQEICLRSYITILQYFGQKGIWMASRTQTFF